MYLFDNFAFQAAGRAGEDQFLGAENVCFSCKLPIF
jgi:hypothetical protein